MFFSENLSTTLLCSPNLNPLINFCLQNGRGGAKPIVLLGFFDFNTLSGTVHMTHFARYNDSYRHLTSTRSIFEEQIPTIRLTDFAYLTLTLRPTTLHTKVP